VRSETKPLVLVGLMVLACTAAPAAPTPNIDATVEARAKELVAEQVNNLQPNPDLGMDYLQMGLGYSGSGDWQLAIGDFTKAIELGIPSTHHSGGNPLAVAYQSRGVAYRNLGQYQRAIQDFDKAIQLDPNYAMAYYNRGVAYQNQRWDEVAIRDFDKAIQLDPDNAMAYYNRGVAYKELGRYHRAIEDYDRVI